jgi:addiction module HigA family antidote
MTESRTLAFPPAHPGAFLREDVLPYLDIGHERFAEHIGISNERLASLLAEEAGLTVDEALRIGKALGNGARFWLSLQMQYDIWRAEQNGPHDIKPLSWTNAA